MTEEAPVSQRSGKALIVSLDDPSKGGGVGGKHTHIRLLAKGLSTHGMAAEIAAPKITPTFKYLRLYPGAFVRRLLTGRDAKYAHYSGQYAKELGRVLQRISKAPEYVNAQDVVAMAKLLEIHPDWARDVPIILTLHGYFTREAASDGELREGSLQYQRFLEMERRVYRNAWRIVCVDTRIREYVSSIENVEEKRMSVLPNAVDTDTFVPATPARRTASRQKLGLPDDAFVILCPRRLVAKNGVTFAVKALASLKDTLPSARLILAGDGPQKAEIEGMIHTEGLRDRVRVEGSVPHDNILRYYDASDAVLIPSVQVAGVEEATSLSMLEGMACGKPVIVTNVGGLKETVRDGVTGLVVIQKDSEAIAKEILDISKNAELAALLGKNARKYVEEHHSYVEHAKTMLAEYRKAALDGPP